MQSNQISLPIVKSGIFLACLIAGSHAFVSEWSGCPLEEIIDIDLGRKDRGIIYGIYRELWNGNDTEDEYELRWRAPGRENTKQELDYTLHSEKEWDIIGFYSLGQYGIFMPYLDNRTDNLEFLIMDLYNNKSFQGQTNGILYDMVGDLIFHEDRVSILIRNETMCGSSKTCLISFTNRGKMIDEPQPFEPFINRFNSTGAPWVPASSDVSSSKLRGYYRESWNPAINATMVSYLREDGTEIESFESPEGYYSAFSTNFGLLVRCAMDYEVNNAGKEKFVKKVKCIQFDPSTLKLLKNETITVRKNAVSLAVINIKGGGFILSTAVVGNSTGRPATETFDVIKLNSEGGLKKYKPLPLGWKCPYDNSQLLLSEITQSDQHHCFSFSCEYNRGSNHNYTYYNECFRMDDLRAIE